MMQNNLSHKIPLSPYSRTFYTEWKLSPHSSDYNIVFDQELEGEVDTLKISDALQRLVLENVLLNSHVENKNESLHWIKNNEIYKLEFVENPLEHDLISSFIEAPFNLEGGPLYRFILIKNKNNKYRFISIFHHIIIDGSSFDYFVNEISNYYNNEAYKKSLSITDQISQISDLSQNQLLQLELNKEKSKSFWKEKLSEIESVDLKFLKGIYRHKATDFKSLNVSSESDFPIKEIKGIKKIRFNFGKKTSRDLRFLHEKYQISPYLFSKSIYAVLLHKYTGQDKFCISYPISIKEGKDFIFGAQVNTNLMPYDFLKLSNVADVIDQSKNFIRSLKSESVSHSYLPISDIVSVSHKNLLNCSFVQTNLRDKQFEFSNIKSTINSSTHIDLFVDLLFEQEVKDEEINFRVRYRSDEINAFLVENFIESYKKLFRETLTDFLKNEEDRNLVPFNKQCLLSEIQYKEIVEGWNKTEQAYPSEKTIQRLFEDQVERTPENIAVIYEGRELTYRELNERANQVAHCIRGSHEIKPDTLIALFLDRSEHMLIGILGVLKAGGAYVPLDPSYPDSRIEYMLEDTGTSLILTNQCYQEKLEEIVKADIEVLAIDDSRVKELLSSQDLSNPKTETTSHHLAYVIYTSGTTGNPKGVMQLHGNVMRLFTATEDWYHFGSSDVWTLFHSYVFDFSVWEIWGALIYGGKLLIPSYEQTRDLSLFYALCEQQNVTVLNQTPSSFYQFSGLSVHRNKLKNLRYVIFGGEALNLSQLKPWFDYYGYNQPKLINMYGITETTVHVTYKPIEEKDLGEQSYIGELIPDLKGYVLDCDLNPLPVGAIGELYIGGVGLARGYLNNPQLTEERFIYNPFQTEGEKSEHRNARLYKTGDLVRWCGDGTLEYIGRNDFQVKIRGYRIELGEIETALSSYEGVQQSVVLAKDHKGSDGKNKYLVGYYVSERPLILQQKIRHAEPG